MVLSWMVTDTEPEEKKTINVVEIDESRYFVFFAHKKNIRVAS